MYCFPIADGGNNFSVGGCLPSSACVPTGCVMCNLHLHLLLNSVDLGDLDCLLHYLSCTHREGNRSTQKPFFLNAAMHNASFSQRYPYPFFLQRHRCDALPCFSASPVEIFTSHTSPFSVCFHFSFRHNGLLYKTTRNLPRVTTQRCRHSQREMANANANAAMRCTRMRGIAMCFLTVSSRLCLETNPHNTLRTPFAGHCLGAL